MYIKFLFCCLINRAGPLLDEKSGEELPRMDARFVEDIVRKWQNIKSQAFGPDHSIGKLPEVRTVGYMFFYYMVIRT